MEQYILTNENNDILKFYTNWAAGNGGDIESGSLVCEDVVDQTCDKECWENFTQNCINDLHANIQGILSSLVYTGQDSCKPESESFSEVGRTFSPYIYTIDDSQTSLPYLCQLYAPKEIDNNARSLCSPQSRLHNWLDTDDAIIDTNRNAIDFKNTKEERFCLGDTKAVGYGRKQTTETVFYNNPFDPRLTFNGLCDWTAPKGSRPLKENSNSKIEKNNGNQLTHFDNFLNDYQKFVNSLTENEIKKSSSLKNTPLEQQLAKLIEAELVDLSNVEEKQLADKIFNQKIKNLWPVDHSRRWSKTSELKEMIPKLADYKECGISSNFLRANSSSYASKVAELKPCPESWRLRQKQQDNNKTDTCKQDDIIPTDSDIQGKCSNKLLNQLPEVDMNTVTNPRPLVWWQETNCDINITKNLYTLPDTYGFDETKNIDKKTNAFENDMDQVENTSQNDWFKEVMEASGLTQFIGLSKDSPAQYKKWSETPDLSPYPQICEDTHLRITKENACPLPLKPASSSISRSTPTITTQSLAPQGFSIETQGVTGLEKSPSVKTSTVTIPQHQPQTQIRTGNTKTSVNEVNIHQLFQAAQAGCHTVISRGMLPYTCFLNQQPTFIRPNPPLIWQPILTTGAADNRKSSLFCQTRPVTSEQTVVTSTVVTVSTATFSSVVAGEGRTQSQHRQSPVTWLSKDDKRRQGSEGSNDNLIDLPSTNTNRNGSLCIPVAFSLGRPAPSPMTAPLTPACFTPRPAIQIAFNSNQPPGAPFTAPFSALYRANYCNIKNINKNNSGAASSSEAEGTFSEEISRDDRAIVVHGMPDMCAPITIQPSLSSLQANIIQIFPTKIVYS